MALIAARPGLPAVSPYAHVKGHVASQRLGPPRLGSFHAGTPTSTPLAAPRIPSRFDPAFPAPAAAGDVQAAVEAEADKNVQRQAGGSGAQPPAGDYDSSWQFSLSLANIRGALIRQEDSIIFSLIERAQFRRNAPAYTTDPALGGIVVPGFAGSLLEYVMTETEVLHGKVRRYTSPTERPFFPDAIPPTILPPLAYPEVLHSAAQSININAVVWNMYFDELLPAIAAPGDDFNYGSAVTSDVLCLQALSKRIHYGVFVAEAKFVEAPDVFGPLIKAQDAKGILRLLTKESVEAAVLRRVEAKAAAFGQDIAAPQVAPPPPPAAAAAAEPDSQSGAHSTGLFEAVPDGAVAGPGTIAGSEKRYKVAPEVVAELYGRWIMPLTKQVQVDYLLRRQDPE